MIEHIRRKDKVLIDRQKTKEVALMGKELIKSAEETASLGGGWGGKQTTQTGEGGGPQGPR